MKKTASRISAVISSAMLLHLAMSLLLSYIFNGLNGIPKAILDIFTPILITAATVAFMLFTDKNATVMRIVPTKEKSPSAPSRDILMSASVLLLIFIFGLLYAGVFPNAGYTVYFGGSTFETVLTVIGMTVVPAICEELLFRYCLAANMKICGSVAAVIISSLFFGLTHFSVYVFPYAFICGILLCSLYFETGKLRCSIAVHFLNNLLSFILSYLDARYSKEISSYTVWGVCVLLVICCIVSFLFVKRSRIRILREPETEHAEMSAFFTFPFLVYLLCVAAVYIFL